MDEGMNDDRFDVVVHHGGIFVHNGGFHYINGEKTVWSCDPDRWSYFEVLNAVKEIEYVNIKGMWYAVEKMLQLLSDDNGAINMVNVARRCGEVHLFVVHGVDEAEIVDGVDEDEVTPTMEEVVPIVGGENILYICHAPVVDEVAGVSDEVGGVDVQAEVYDVGTEVEVVEMDDVINEMEAEVEVGEVDAEAENRKEMEDVMNEMDAEVLVGEVDADAENGKEMEDVMNEMDAEVLVGEVEAEAESGKEMEDMAQDQSAEIEARTEAPEVADDVEVEVGINEDIDSDEEASKGDFDNRGPNFSDVGMSDDEWQSEELLSGPDSDSETIGVEERTGCGSFHTFVMPKSMEDYKWEVGTVFLDNNHFKEAVRTYAIHAGRNLKFIKNDNKRVKVGCLGAQGKCQWSAYCAYMPTRKIWQLRKLVDVHCCSRSFKINIIKAKWLSETLDRTLRENPKLKINDVRHRALRKWNTNVSISMARKARALAAEVVDGSFQEQFKRIYDYAHELLRCNPGSTVKVKVEDVNGEPIFQRFYTCLKACKDSFVSCRPIIGLDGCFLKGKYGGELLSAVGTDANDQLLPLAYAVVEVENKETWTWFLELLINDLGGVDMCGAMTFMSDQQKGLVPAIHELLRIAEHRFCMRHLYANFRKRFSGQKLKILMWRAARCTHPEAWEKVMLSIKEVNIDAYKYLIAIPPRFWSKSRFSGRAVCDTLVNNMSEAFNSVIVNARCKPIITMLEEIRLYFMTRWANKRNKVSSLEGSICPKIVDRLCKEKQLTKYWIPSWSGEKIFEVGHISMVGDKYVVNVDAHHCSCRKWLLTGIPCCHAIAAMNFLNLKAEEYIPMWFRHSTYEETYESIIYPLNGELLWERTQYPDVHPPKKRTLPGRPKKKRRLEEWELRKDHTQMSKGGHRKKCSICRVIGHNKKNCPHRPVDEVDTTPTVGHQEFTNTTQPDGPPQQTHESQPTPPINTTESQPLNECLNEANQAPQALTSSHAPTVQVQRSQQSHPLDTRMKLQFRRPCP